MLPTSRIFAGLCGVLLGCASAARPSPSPSTPSPSTDATDATPRAAPLRLASSPWPPFTDGPDHPALALEIVETALERAGHPATIEVVPAGTLTDQLREGRYDGSAALWPSAEREAFLLYSDPYLENRLILVGRKGSPVDVPALSALAGKKLGLVRGYAYGPDIEQAPGPEIVHGESTAANLRALLEGKLDYVLVDALVMHHVMQHEPERAAERLAVGTNALSSRTLHLAVRKDLPNARAILDAFNRELARMRTDGSYNTALQLNWIRTDIDGDGVPELVAVGERVGTLPPSMTYELMAPVSTGVSSDTPREPPKPRFVINGVPYDTWDAVPTLFKRQPIPLEAKPRTLRVEIFQF